VENVFGGPLADLGVTRDRDFHRSERECVVFSALDLLPLDGRRADVAEPRLAS